MELIINLEVDGAFKTKKIEKDIDGIFEPPLPENDEDELNEQFKKRIENKNNYFKGKSLDKLKEDRRDLPFKKLTLTKEEINKRIEELDERIKVVEDEEKKEQYFKKIDDSRVENKFILFDPGMIYDSNLGKKGNPGSKIFIDYRFSMEKMKLPKSVKKITTDIQEIVTSADLFQKVSEYNLKKLKGDRKNYLFKNIDFLCKLFLKKKTKILLNGIIYEIIDDQINPEFSEMGKDGNIYTIQKIIVIKESDSTPANIKKLKKQLKKRESKKNCQEKRNEINNNSQQLLGIDIFESETSDEEEEETILDNDNLYLGPLYGKFNKGGRKIKKKTKRKPKRKTKTKTKKLN